MNSRRLMRPPIYADARVSEVATSTKAIVALRSAGARDVGLGSRPCQNVGAKTRVEPSSPAYEFSRDRWQVRFELNRLSGIRFPSVRTLFEFSHTQGHFLSKSGTMIKLDFGLLLYHELTFGPSTYTGPMLPRPD